MSRKVAIYDNGGDNIKSYLAAAEGFLFAMLPNLYAFDAGIVSWAKKYPELTLLMGEDLSKNGKSLITEEELNKHLLAQDTFVAKASAKGVEVFDLRDPIERKKDLPVQNNTVLKIPMEKFVNNIVSKGNLKDKPLYVFDQVGGKVQWLMYHLVANGYTDFYFLYGGATSILKEQDYSVKLPGQAQ